MVKLDELKKHDKVFFARTMPKLGYYEIFDCVVVDIDEKYCIVSDTKTKQSFLIHNSRAEEVLFKDRKLAVKYLKEEEQKYEL
ncbi:MAG: hypothetical protein IJA10_11565 [Lachnospiraceae bacterium]|nr:hypothetical protein [Lachnospiraceae bacterium]